MKANDLLFYNFYSHNQSFHQTTKIPQTTKIETYQKAKDQPPTQAYLLGTRACWVSPPGWGVGHTPFAALCPALWPKGSG